MPYIQNLSLSSKIVIQCITISQLHHMKVANGPLVKHDHDNQVVRMGSLPVAEISFFKSGFQKFVFQNQPVWAVSQRFQYSLHSSVQHCTCIVDRIDASKCRKIISLEGFSKEVKRFELVSGSTPA